MISYVQQTTNTLYLGSNSSTTTVPINNLPSVGNTLVGIAKRSSGQVLNSITDPRGNTWNVDASSLLSGKNGLYAVRCIVVTPYQAGDSLVLHWNFSTNGNGMLCSEFSGLLQVGTVVDQTGLTMSGTNSTSVTLSLSSSTTNPGDLLLTSISTGVNNNTFTAPTGFTEQPASTPTSSAMDMAFQLANAIGAFSNTWSWATSTSYSALLVSYFPSAAAQFLQLMNL